jgi:hypothetical protein
MRPETVTQSIGAPLCARGKLKRRSPSYEVHNLQLVSVFELSLRPLIARDDLKIQFYGDTIGLHSQQLNQTGESEAVREFALVAVEVDLHEKLKPYR